MLNYTTVTARGNKRIKLNIYPGHYATSHAHVDNYIGMTEIRSSAAMAREAAVELARPFQYTSVDSIICLEYTQTIGSFLAMELSGGGRAVNTGADIHVVTPQINSNNQLTFSNDFQNYVTGQNVLLLISTVSTGRSLARAAECIEYYGGKLVGICSIFSAVEESGNMPIHTIFKKQDINEYNSYRSNQCPLCQRGRKIDGLINAGGCTKLN